MVVVGRNHELGHRLVETCEGRQESLQYRVSGFGFRISGFGFRVSGVGCRCALMWVGRGKGRAEARNRSG